jgi:hypothetical protein
VESKTQSDEAKANAKILKAMMICIVAFFIMSFPLGVIRLIKIYQEKNAEKVPEFFTLSTTFFQFFSSCVNPMIYGFFRKDFRDAYARIWKNIKKYLSF